MGTDLKNEFCKHLDKYLTIKGILLVGESRFLNKGQSNKVEIQVFQHSIGTDPLNLISIFNNEDNYEKLPIKHTDRAIHTISVKGYIEDRIKEIINLGQKAANEFLEYFNQAAKVAGMGSELEKTDPNNLNGKQERYNSAIFNIANAEGVAIDGVSKVSPFGRTVRS